MSISSIGHLLIVEEYISGGGGSALPRFGVKNGLPRSRTNAFCFFFWKKKTFISLIVHLIALVHTFCGGKPQGRLRRGSGSQWSSAKQNKRFLLLFLEKEECQTISSDQLSSAYAFCFFFWKKKNVRLLVAANDPLPTLLASLPRMADWQERSIGQKVEVEVGYGLVCGPTWTLQEHAPYSPIDYQPKTAGGRGFSRMMCASARGAQEKWVSFFCFCGFFFWEFLFRGVSFLATWRCARFFLRTVTVGE
jgi:hypothetical protein